jgi:methylated-DNA-protein-cysteine methyltransferase related protein
VPRFEDAVIAVLRSLEPGDVLTYGEVAAEAGFPGAARAVGSLLRKADGVPWWRVVGSGGWLRSPSPDRQAGLLAAEGVNVVNGKVVSAGSLRE